MNVNSLHLGWWPARPESAGGGRREGIPSRWLGPALIGISGLLITVFGFLLISVFNSPTDKIEIIPADQNEQQKSIFADIEGAVIKPGVYELPSGSRLDNLLIMAGGLANKADRDWIEKNLNRAQKLTDGVKIYIPERSLKKPEVGNAGGLETNKTNINTASLDQLDTLPGIGPVTAKKIIDNRPYSQISELLDRKIVTKKVYLDIEGRVIAY